MRRALACAGITSALCIASAAAAQEIHDELTPTTWTVDSASITFEIRNAGLPVRGSFDGLEAKVCFDPDEPAAGRIVASLDPRTIETGIGMRDRHLSRRGWFEVDRYGPIEMRSLGFDRTGTGYAGRFALRIRDVERDVEIPFTFRTSGTNAAIAGSLTINRLDWGVGGESLILSDSVRITVDLELVRSTLPCR